MPSATKDPWLEWLSCWVVQDTFCLVPVISQLKLTPLSLAFLLPSSVYPCVCSMHWRHVWHRYSTVQRWLSLPSSCLHALMAPGDHGVKSAILVLHRPALSAPFPPIAGSMCMLLPVRTSFFHPSYAGLVTTSCQSQPWSWLQRGALFVVLRSGIFNFTATVADFMYTCSSWDWWAVYCVSVY